MGTKQVKTSDISGRDLLDEEVVVVTVKDAGRKFDCAVDELKQFKIVSNVVELEVQRPGVEKETLLVDKATFEKLIPKEKLTLPPDKGGFRSNRGREPGFSPLVKSSTNGSAPASV